MKDKILFTVLVLIIVSLVAALCQVALGERFYAPPYSESACPPGCTQCLPVNNPLPILTPVKADPLRVNVDKPVALILYTAKWCGACHSQFRMLGRLKREGYPVYSIDVDDSKFARFLKRQPYAALPHFLMVRDGRTWQVRRGSIDESTVRRWFAKAGFVPPQRQVVRYVPAPVEQYYPRSFMRSGGLVGIPGYGSGCGNPGCAMCYGR